MSLHVLDTDMLTLVEEGHPEVSKHFLGQRAEDVAITVLTVEEQLGGWYTELRKAKRPRSWRGLTGGLQTRCASIALANPDLRRTGHPTL
jgi:tRNA(fMet)-specific endonuclease VapC